MDYKSSAKKLDATLLQHGVQMQLPAYLSVLRHWREPKKLFGVSRLIPAGVFYVNLRGSRESAGNRTMAATVDRKLAYQHTGRFDAAMLEKLDSRPDKNGDQFKYRRNKDGSLHGGSAEAMDHTAFTTLLDNVEAQLTDMGRRIFAGETAVDPYRRGGASACDYCDYRAVCRIDPWTHRYRVLNKPDKLEDGAT